MIKNIYKFLPQKLCLDYDLYSIADMTHLSEHVKLAELIHNR